MEKFFNYDTDKTDISDETDKKDIKKDVKQEIMEFEEPEEA